MLKHPYLCKVLQDVIHRNPNETEFHQTVTEVLESIEPVVAQNPASIEKGIIDMTTSVYITICNFSDSIKYR